MTPPEAVEHSLASTVPSSVSADPCRAFLGTETPYLVPAWKCSRKVCRVSGSVCRRSVSWKIHGRRAWKRVPRGWDVGRGEVTRGGRRALGWGRVSRLVRVWTAVGLLHAALEGGGPSSDAVPRLMTT